MSQHFLLSAKARTLSLASIYKAGEERAYQTFCELRWPENEGKPVCPSCGCIDSYSISTRRRFKCAGCHRQYSVTSGTILANRKLSFVDLLAAICIIVNAAKGASALQLARDLDCQHKTAFVLSHKLREALAAEVKGAMLSGEIEIDGCHVGGHIRPANLKENRVDRRRAPNQSGKRRVVIALRQREGRTLTFVDTHEPKGVAIARERVAKGSTIIADEAMHWDTLPRDFAIERINHSVAYSLDGVSTNQVESFFARLRKMIGGQHHHVSPRYLHQYAAHAAWMEDHSRLDNGKLFRRALSASLSHPVSREWKGYWQRNAT